MIDMKIRDEEFRNYSDKVKELASCIENKLSSLHTQLQLACDEGAVSGHFHDNLQLFTDVVGSLADKLNRSALEIAQGAINYDRAIGKKDGDIYSEGAFLL